MRMYASHRIGSGRAIIGTGDLGIMARIGVVKSHLLQMSMPSENRWADWPTLPAGEDLVDRDMFKDPRLSELAIAPEEVRVWEATYRNQGLFPNHNSNIVKRINFYGMQSGKYPIVITPSGLLDTAFKSRWWHFIYKIPRRFGKF